MSQYGSPPDQLAVVTKSMGCRNVPCESGSFHSSDIPGLRPMATSEPSGICDTAQYPLLLPALTGAAVRKWTLHEGMSIDFCGAPSLSSGMTAPRSFGDQ